MSDAVSVLAEDAPCEIALVHDSAKEGTAEVLTTAEADIVALLLGLSAVEKMVGMAATDVRSEIAVSDNLDSGDRPAGLLCSQLFFALDGRQSTRRRFEYLEHVGGPLCTNRKGDISGTTAGLRSMSSRRPAQWTSSTDIYRHISASESDAMVREFASCWLRRSEL